MDEWKPGDSGWAIGTMAGGPFDGQTYGDLPRSPEGEAPGQIRIPIQGNGPAGPFAVYDLQAGAEHGCLYVYAGDGAGSQDAVLLPAGATVRFGTAPLPARRFRIAQSWWIASELCRRHPGRHILEQAGETELLRVLKPLRGPLAFHHFCDLDRAAGIEAGRLRLGWDAVLAADSPHDIVRTIEHSRRRDLQGRAPTTTRRVLTYRVAARLLAMRIDDRAAWDVRSDWVLAQHGGGSRRGFLHGFPTALSAFEHAGSRATLADDAEHFWGVLRNDECRAVLDDAGVLHGLDGERDLMTVYRRRHRLQDVMAEVQEVLAR